MQKSLSGARGQLLRFQLEGKYFGGGLADYDGDAKADPAVRSETGNEWIVMFSSGNYTPVHLTLVFE